jgi:hypothetical protein
MKTWALGAMAISTFALMACGSSSGGSTSTESTAGTGGKSSGSSSSVVSSTTGTSTGGSAGTSTGGAGGSDACTSGADCTTCADQNTCITCETTAHPEGSNTFNTYLECLLCTACYYVCDGTTQGCTTAPATVDACDSQTMMADMAACDTATPNCATCAQAGTCKPQVTACQNDPDCVAFDQGLQACPTM